jgi:hypothetical protein
MKLQIKFQKILCIVSILLAAFAFAFSLGISTDIYQLMLAGEYGVETGGLYDVVQDFNHNLVFLCIVMILTSTGLFITGTNTRRNYYVSNYVAIILTFLFDTITCIICIKQISSFKATFLTEVDFEMWALVHEMISEIRFTESTFWFDINTLMLTIIIICNILLVLNLIWKTMLMKKEKALLTKTIQEVQRNE